MMILKLCKSGFLFLLFFIVFPCSAEEKGSPGFSGYCPDSIVRMSTFPEIDLGQYYADRSLHYGKEPLQVTGFWSRLLVRLMKVLGTILDQKATPVIFYLVVFSSCAYILIRYLRGEAESAWQSDKENSLLFTEEGSQLSSTDLAALLQEEISAGNYNKAVRILFLQTIQQLAQQGFISLHQEKTNSDFIHEITDSGIRDQFRELTRIYEFLWYGNQAVDQSYFDRIASQFHLFNNRIHG